MSMKQATKRIIFIIISLIFILFTIVVGKYIILFANDKESFKLWVESYGLTGYLLYSVLTITQIIACFIPGEPLEILAGYAFSSLKGTLICLLAESIGSIIVILLTRKFGKKVVAIFFSEEKIESVSFLKSSKKNIILFLILFMIPGTPKDLLCYCVGLTNIPLNISLLITTIGRIPSIITSTIPGSALVESNYFIALLILGITGIISLISLFFYNRLTKRKQ